MNKKPSLRYLAREEAAWGRLCCWSVFSFWPKSYFWCLLSPGLISALFTMAGLALANSCYWQPNCYSILLIKNGYLRFVALGICQRIVSQSCPVLCGLGSKAWVSLVLLLLEDSGLLYTISSCPKEHRREVRLSSLACRVRAPAPSMCELQLSLTLCITKKTLVCMLTCDPFCFPPSFRKSAHKWKGFVSQMQDKINHAPEWTKGFSFYPVSKQKVNIH